ncbi:DUF2156 domain-containing protein [Nakamurella leprariae]|uniref:DUF2156 domain-containing protein n=1 Tax=Nakamurella leprariae TaxID=2803911 RepID=A0A938YF19_9ACTN|nr:DUF2156 domain-containing protein [Nakamurella leprariae]MBM9466655.1 DUF2156 domain-containing protein [Nakamurella leprariae]
MSTTVVPPAEPAPAPPGRFAAPARRAGEALRRLLPQLRSTPVVLVWLVAFWAAGAVTGSLVHGPDGQPDLATPSGTGLWNAVAVGIPTLRDGHWWTPFTAPFFAADLITYLGASVLLVATAAAVERRWGSRRTLLIAIAVLVLGTALGLAVIELATLVPDWTWASQLEQGTAVSPTPLVFGLLAAASADMSALWRRRLRLALVAVGLVMLLYGGRIEDVLRLASTLVGLAIGAFVLHRGQRHVLATRSSIHETRVLVAVVFAASTLGPVLCAFSDDMDGPLQFLQVLYVGPDVAEARGVADMVMALVPAALVLVLTAGLRRGRRFAWWAMLGVHAALLIIGVVFAFQLLAVADDIGLSELADEQGISLVASLAPLAVIPVLLMLLLWLTRRSFTVSAPARTYRRFGLLVGATVLVGWVLSVGLGALVEDQYTPVPTFWQLVADYPLRLLPNGYGEIVNPGFEPDRDTFAEFLTDWLGVVVWLVVLVGLLRSFVKAAVTSTALDAERARDILDRHGVTSLAWLTTWEGNSWWFSADGSSYVAYRVEGGVALTTGDPIGPADRLEATIREFVDHCSHQGWIPAFYSTTEAVKQVTDRLGWPSLQVAEETVLPLGSVAFAGKKFQDIRTAISRAGKAGVTAEWISYPTAPLAVRDQIQAISEEWVSDKALPEMGFTLGGIAELDDPHVRCLIAVDESRTVHAVTSWMPSFRDGQVIGYTLDFMRRRSTGDLKGLMEFLIGRAALDLQAEGLEFLSLSGAPLAHADPSAPSTAVDRVLEWIGRTMEPVYGFRSLLKFKAKFQPEYQPMYMNYPEQAVLPRIGLGISHAYLPHLTVTQTVRMIGELT